jgi:predicted GIY-YIG superfamily endonuclease
MYSLYVISLDDECFYIGSTKYKPDSRIEQHGGKDGSAWARAHRPTGRSMSINARTSDEDGAKARENCLTWLYMHRYGWQRVRGGFYCHVDEEETRKGLQSHGFFDSQPVEWRGLTPERALNAYLPSFLEQWRK